MINLGNFRIIRIDLYNLTFEQFKEVYHKKTDTKEMEWTRVGGYYGNLQQCLKALKDYIISIEMESNEEINIINLLDEINNKYINCNLKASEE